MMPRAASKLLNPGQPEWEAEVEPDGMADDLGRKPIAGVAGASGCRHPTRLLTSACQRKRDKARQVDGTRRSSTPETSTRWTSPFFAEGRQNDGRGCLKLFCLWAALLIVLDLLVTSQGSFNAHLTWATPQHLQLLRSEENLPRIGYTCAPSEQTVLPILSCFREHVGMDFSHIGRWPPDSSPIFALVILAGVALFWWTGVPEVGLIAAAAVKILLPQHRPGEEEDPARCGRRGSRDVSLMPMQLSPRSAFGAEQGALAPTAATDHHRARL